MLILLYLHELSFHINDLTRPDLHLHASPLDSKALPNPAKFHNAHLSCLLFEFFGLRVLMYHRAAKQCCP